MSIEPKYIWVDFNTRGVGGAGARGIGVGGLGSQHDVAKQGVLTEGEEVVLYEPDAEEGKECYMTQRAAVRRDITTGEWIAHFAEGPCVWIDKEDLDKELTRRGLLPRRKLQGETNREGKPTGSSVVA